MRDGNDLLAGHGARERDDLLARAPGGDFAAVMMPFTADVKCLESGDDCSADFSRRGVSSGRDSGKAEAWAMDASSSAPELEAWFSIFWVVRLWPNRPSGDPSAALWKCQDAMSSWNSCKGKICGVI